MMSVVVRGDNNNHYSPVHDRPKFIKQQKNLNNLTKQMFVQFVNNMFFFQTVCMLCFPSAPILLQTSFLLYTIASDT